MGYLGIRTTGSTYGYRVERRAYSNRVRSRQDREEAEIGLLEYLDPQHATDAGGARRQSKRRRGRITDHRPGWCGGGGCHYYCACPCPSCRKAREETDYERFKMRRIIEARERSGETARFLARTAPETARRRRR